ncbi:BhlA/UviB family holin-like peptide [Clostridium formicaceticum]|uniref:Bacteriocin n=1 Tax=Clostridium formicaceticum TaxID=1497 RepID=A0AAC9RK68_9CLOT|nr:BhlA/UviB family holin-like peptide [Clostridium formicaceticum]AOY76696.1 bacteriocin [Clostridium formicaceticum]ARE87129.1 Bacteriocin UviB precursor [Clostridium formicaceticum]
MENEVIKMLVGQGVFAILFGYLLFYVLKENSKREIKYQEIIQDLSGRFNIIEDVQKDVKEIKNKVFR